MFKGCTFDNQNVTSQNDGGLYQQIFSTDGVLWGCIIGATPNSITVHPGLMVISGRIIRVDGATSIEFTQPISNGYGQVVIQIDLSQTATTTTFEQLSTIVNYSTTTLFPSLTQEKINQPGAGTIYQAQLAVVKISGGNITGLMEGISSAQINANTLDNQPPNYYLTEHTSSLTYYVAQNGSDTTGNGSQNSPYQTIQKCIDSIPSQYALTTDMITINLSNSSLAYAGFIVPKNYSITINGNTDNPYNCTIGSTSITNYGNLYLYGVRVSQPINNQHCGILRVYNCVLGAVETGTITQCISNYGECYIMANNTFASATYGVENSGGHTYVGYASSANASTITSSVTYGLRAVSGAIYTSSYITNNATNAYSRTGSGMIFNNGAII